MKITVKRIFGSNSNLVTLTGLGKDHRKCSRTEKHYLWLKQYHIAAVVFELTTLSSPFVVYANSHALHCRLSRSQVVLATKATIIFKGLRTQVLRLNT